MFQIRLTCLIYITDIPHEVGNGGQFCEDVKTVDFPVQKVCKMMYGDDNTTSEPLNP